MDYLYNTYYMSKMLFDKGSTYMNSKEMNDYVKTKRVFGPNSNGIRGVYNLTYKPDMIIDNIILGNAYNAANYNELKKHNIGLVVNCSKDIPNYFKDDLEYIRVNVDDKLEQPIIDYFEATIERMYEYLLNNPNKNILVHCFMGSSRSASIVIAYLIRYRKYRCRDALNFIKQKRDLVNINVDFFKQLIEYEKKYV